MHLRLVRPDDPWLDDRRPFVRLLSEASAAINGKLFLDERFGHVGRHATAKGSVTPIFGNALGVNPDAAAALAADKDHTAAILSASGLPSPDGLLVFGPAYAATMALKNSAVAAQLPDIDAAIAWARDHGWPVIVKPNQGSEGRGISRASDPSALQSDIKALFATDQKVRIERHCPGVDHRVVVWKGSARLAYIRRPPSVTGDGSQTLETLVAAKCQDLARTSRGAKLDPTHPALRRHLADQGLSMAFRPEIAQHIELLPSANLSKGGTCQDVTDTLPQSIQTLACEAAETLGLRLAGVDILVPEDGLSTILEVNSAPGLDGYITAGPQAHARASQLLQEILSDTARPEDAG